MQTNPTTARATATRARILDAARTLFDERGVAAVSTNHIASQAGVSPGNLYYWFDNKDAIVRELFTEYAAGYEAAWTGTPDDATPADVLRWLESTARWRAGYAFLTRELLGLLHTDAELRRRYRDLRTRRLADFERIGRRWRDAGVGPALTDAELTAVVQALWVLAEMAPPFAELDRIDDADASPGRHAAPLDPVAALLGPWLRGVEQARPESGE